MIATWDTNTALAMGRTAPGRRVLKDGEGIRVLPHGEALRVPLILMDGAPTRPAMTDAEAARADMLRQLGDAWRGGAGAVHPAAAAAPVALEDAEAARAAWLADLTEAWRGAPTRPGETD